MLLLTRIRPLISRRTCITRSPNVWARHDTTLEANRPAYTAKALRDLHQNKEIECRVAGNSLQSNRYTGILVLTAAGKQTVYHALQASDDSASPETLTSLDEQIKDLEERLSTLKADDKKARANLHVLTSTPLLSDLRQDIARLESEEKEITSRLVSSRENAAAVQIVDPAEREHVEQEWKRWRGLAARRERGFRELWGRCSEVVPEGMTREELWVCFCFLGVRVYYVVLISVGIFGVGG